MPEPERETDILQFLEHDPVMVLHDAGYLEANGVGAYIDSSKFHR
jgi:hypothetical protein